MLIFEVMMEGIPGGVYSSSDAEYIRSTFELGYNHLKTQRMSYVFDGANYNPADWKLGTWCKHCRPSVIRQKGTANDILCLPPESAGNKKRNQNGRKCPLNDKRRKVARRKKPEEDSARNSQTAESPIADRRIVANEQEQGRTVMNCHHLSNTNRTATSQPPAAALPEPDDYFLQRAAENAFGNEEVLALRAANQPHRPSQLVEGVFLETRNPDVDNMIVDATRQSENSFRQQLGELIDHELNKMNEDA